jgi:O-antigen/teichoic acid export membrane protein
VAPHFARVFYGEDFVDSAPLMAGLAITIPLIGWGNVIRTLYLIPMKRDGVYILSGCVGAVFNLFLNLLMIPMYGAVGAVAATVLAEISVVFIQSLAVRKELNLMRYIKNSVFPLAAGGLMCFVLRQLCKFTLPSPWMLAVEIVLGALMFLALCLLYALIRKDSVLAYFFQKAKTRRAFTKG